MNHTGGSWVTMTCTGGDNMTGTYQMSCNNGSYNYNNQSLNCDCTAGFARDISGVCKRFQFAATHNNCGSNKSQPCPNSYSSYDNYRYLQYFSNSYSSGTEQFQFRRFNTSRTYDVTFYVYTGATSFNYSIALGFVAATCRLDWNDTVSVAIGRAGYFSNYLDSSYDGATHATGGGTSVFSSSGGLLIYAGRGNAKGDCGYYPDLNCTYNNNYEGYAASVALGQVYSRGNESCQGGFNNGVCSDDSPIAAQSNYINTSRCTLLNEGRSNSYADGYIYIDLSS